MTFPQRLKLSPNFAVVFSVGKDEATGEDDSADIDVAREEEVPCYKNEKETR